MSLGTGQMYRVRSSFPSGVYISGGGVATHYFDQAGGTEAQAITAVKNFWTGVAALIITGMTITVEGVVEWVDPEHGDVTAALGGASQTVASTGGSTPMAAATQGLIRWRTGVYADGREVRGRTFIPAPMISGTLNGAPTAAYMSALETAGAALIADANTKLVAYRRFRPYRPPVGSRGDPWYQSELQERLGGWAPVTVSSAWTKWSGLRSRRD